MSTLTFWFIRHKPTGGYLPEPAGRMGRGGSHVEPTIHVDDLTQPRLFSSKLAAQRALTAWLRGKVHHSSGYDSFTGEGWDELSVEVVPTRTREDMEIVSAELTLP